MAPVICKEKKKTIFFKIEVKEWVIKCQITKKHLKVLHHDKNEMI